MQSTGFPSCCTTDVIFGMGRSRNNGTYTGDRMLPAEKFDKLHDYMRNATRRGMAMLTCVITHDQQQANAALRALGWRLGPWAKSRNHPETKTRLCYWLVQDGIAPEVAMATIKAEYLEKVVRNKLQ